MIPFFVQTLAASQKSGSNFASYTTAKTVINQTELVTLPPNYLRLGSLLRVKVFGSLSTASGNTVTFQVMMGTVVAWSSGALVATTTTNTNLPFSLEVLLRVDTVGTGTGGSYMAVGTVISVGLQPAGSTAGANPTVANIANVLPATAPADGTGWDSTLSQILDFWVGMGTSAAGNNITIQQYIVEQLAGAG